MKLAAVATTCAALVVLTGQPAGAADRGSERSVGSAHLSDRAPRPRDLGRVTLLGIDDTGRVISTTAVGGHRLRAFTPQYFNDEGVVAGTTADGAPAIWRSGRVTPLGTPSVGEGPTTVLGISNEGTVLVQRRTSPYTTEAFLWSRGQFTQLAWGNTWPQHSTYAMNVEGVVFGAYYTPGGPHFGGTYNGVLWAPHSVLPSGTWGGYQPSLVAIGRHGGVSGSNHAHEDFWCHDDYLGTVVQPTLSAPSATSPSFPQGEFLYEATVVNAFGERAGSVGHATQYWNGVDGYCPGTPARTGTGVSLRTGSYLVNFTPAAINDHGLVVGTRTLSTGRTVAVVFDHGRTVDLPGLHGQTSTTAVGVNNRRQVIGYSGTHAVLWRYRLSRSHR